MGKIVDLSGQKYGQLTVLCQAKTVKGHTKWLCQCECGKQIIVDGWNLKTLHTKSCGCYRKEFNKITAKHGLSNTRIYSIWTNMLTRTKNPNYSESHRYLKRGITACLEWQGENGFLHFYEWAMSNGYDDTLTLDRIDNNKGYSPNNCRWVDWNTQQRNRGNNIRIEYQGEQRTLIEWSELLHLNYKKIKQRLYRGWDIERAFTTP